MSTNELKLKPGQRPDELLAEVTGAKKRRHKFAAQRTGHYASRLEANHAAKLETLKRAGHILDFLEQVPVMLPGRIRYVIDFMIIDKDGTVRFVECKGAETRVWVNKQKQLEALRPEIFKRLAVVRK